MSPQEFAEVIRAGHVVEDCGVAGLSAARERPREFCGQASAPRATPDQQIMPAPSEPPAALRGAVAVVRGGGEARSRRDASDAGSGKVPTTGAVLDGCCCVVTASGPCDAARTAAASEVGTDERLVCLGAANATKPPGGGRATGARGWPSDRHEAGVLPTTEPPSGGPATGTVQLLLRGRGSLSAAGSVVHRTSTVGDKERIANTCLPDCDGSGSLLSEKRLVSASCGTGRKVASPMGLLRDELPALVGEEHSDTEDALDDNPSLAPGLSSMTLPTKPPTSQTCSDSAPGPRPALSNAASTQEPPEASGP